MRGTTQQVLHAPAATHLAVDSVKGILFVAEDFKIVRYFFSIDLGDDRMSPKVDFKAAFPMLVFTSAREIKAIAVDADQSVLYVAAGGELSILEYSEEKVD